VLGIEEQVIRTTKVAGNTVAYSVVGEGPPLLVGGWWCSHLTLNWQDTYFRAYLSRLAARHAVVRYDRPGTGASGPGGAIPVTLDDEVAVMAGVVDALGLERFAVVGASSGAATAVAFTAVRPRQVNRLVLYGSFARGEDIAPEPVRSAIIDVIASHWGLGARLLSDVFLPGASTSDREEFVRFQRQSATPEQAARSLAARCPMARQASRTGSGTSNGACGQPSFSRVPLISSSPKGSPWVEALPALVGAP